MKNILRYMFIIAGILTHGVFAGCSDDGKLGSASIDINGFTPMEGLPGTEVLITASGLGDQARVFLMKQRLLNMYLVQVMPS